MREAGKRVVTQLQSSHPNFLTDELEALSNPDERFPTDIWSPTTISTSSEPIADEDISGLEQHYKSTSASSLTALKRTSIPCISSSATRRSSQPNQTYPLPTSSSSSFCSSITALSQPASPRIRSIPRVGGVGPASAGPAIGSGSFALDHFNVGTAAGVYQRSISIIAQLEKSKGLLKMADDQSGNRPLTILHFNDVYNVEPISEQEPVGGAARFCTALKQHQADNPLILFSGDIFSPSMCKPLSIDRL